MSFAFSILRLRRFLKSRMCSFGGNRNASVSVEMAFILPTFAAMAFLTWDAGTVYTQYKRGARHYYAIGDIMSGQTSDVTCSRLDTISELVYDSYAAGNWARRPEKGSGVSFDQDGALDFRFIIYAIRAELQPNGKYKGRVKWAYYRDNRDMESNGGKKPGDLLSVPNGMRIDGLEYIMVDGNLFIAPAINYLGIFDYAPDKDNQVHKQVPINRYFPLRFLPSLNVVETVDDPFTDKCSDGSNYPA